MSRLSHDDVLQMVGAERLDDHSVAEIIALGANREELTEALNRLERGSGVGAETLRPPSARVLHLCDILAKAEEGWTLPDEP